MRGERYFFTILKGMDHAKFNSTKAETSANTSSDDTNYNAVTTETGVTETSWQTHLEAGHAASALQHYYASAGSDGEVIEALTTLAEVRRQVRAKGWSKAQRAMARLEVCPDSVGRIIAWEGLGEQLKILETTSKLLDRHETEAALETLQRVTSPLLSAEVETQRGTAHILMNDEERAKAAFIKALEHDPKHYRALTNRGNLSLEENNVDEAIATYEAALKLNEDFANAHHNLGIAYRRKGKIDKSVRSIRRAQKAMRAQDAEEAKGTFSGTLSSIGGRLSGRRLRYLLYGGGAILVFLWLRSQGMI